MAVLDIRRRTGYLFLVVTVAHIVLISAQVSTKRGVPLLEEVVFGLFAQIQRTAALATDSVAGAWNNYVNLTSVRSENAALKREVDQMQVRLQQEQALAAQSRSLQALLDLKMQTPLSTVAASVIAGGASPAFRTITIDRGTSTGLRPDMAVLAAGGVVGRVILPTVDAAKVQLLADGTAAVAALVERSRVQGIVVGTGAGLLRLTYVSGTADLKVGDRLVTSGIDGIYPKGFAIGEIESIERTAGEFTNVMVRPSVDFTSLETVLVVLSPAPAPTATDVRAPE